MSRCKYKTRNLKYVLTIEKVVLDLKIKINQNYILGRKG